jgi:ribulose-5-phosphate 4-epimerase/fuculose-1-phosphate aldolase
VAWACRILAAHGYQDLTLGHVSVRGESGGPIYIKRKGVSLSEVTPDDILALELADDLAASPDMHLEAVLHTEVYRARPDVGAVIHGHPPFATAFGATDAELSVLTHDGILFAGEIAVYSGVPDLIIDLEQGRDVAAALGRHTTLLLRNHGVLIAERDLAWAVLTAVTLERAIELQTIASQLGRLRPIPAEQAREIHGRKYQNGLVSEYWDAWIRELRREGKALGMPQEDGR